MRKIAEKIAVAALICITFVFVLTSLLYVTETINNYNTYEFYDANGVVLVPNNGLETTLLVVLAVVYLVLAGYLLYVTFAERESLRSILLFCDSDSATRTSAKVINNVVKGCSRQVEGIAVRKIRVRTDEKGGLAATVYVKVRACEVAEKVNLLRGLLADSFKSTLNLTFNTINFQIDKLNGKYVPDAEQAEKLAESLQENQENMSESYHEPPTPENIDNASEKAPDEEHTNKEQTQE